MPKGHSAKGYKMTKNRIHILEVVAGQGGVIQAQDGSAGRMLVDLLNHKSPVSLNATLRELEELGFLRREIEGRRTYEIAITRQGREVIGKEEEPAPVPTTATPERPGAPTVRQLTAAADAGSTTTAPVEPSDPATWDWDEEKPAVPGDIDYDILLGVFLKAALRGMEPSNNGELGYYKQQNELAVEKIQNLEALVEKLRTEAASAIAERDQIQKNLNVIMSKLDKRPARGTSPIRNLLSPGEQNMLDNLMKQIPTRRGGD